MLKGIHYICDITFSDKNNAEYESWEKFKKLPIYDSTKTYVGMNEEYMTYAFYEIIGL